MVKTTKINKLKINSKTLQYVKRSLLPLTSEDRLKELPSIYDKIRVDNRKIIESAKQIFSNIIKRIPPESYRKFKIDYDQSNDINISGINYNSDDDKFAS